jgi:hypothetical protein
VTAAVHYAPTPFAPGSWAAQNRERAKACCLKAFGKVPRHQLEWVDGKRDAVAYRRFRQANLRSIRALIARLDAAGVAYRIVGVGPRGGFDKARCQLPRFDIERQAPTFVARNDNAAPLGTPTAPQSKMQGSGSGGDTPAPTPRSAPAWGHYRRAGILSASTTVPPTPTAPTVAEVRNLHPAPPAPAKATQPAWGYLKRAA